MGLVAPAVLPSSREDFEKNVALLARIPHVSRIQIDVVDGRFASPASWPYNALEENLHTLVEKNYMLPALDHIAYEIDLMCFDAEQAADAWLKLGATRLTFHVESSIDLPRLVRDSRSRYGDVISFGLAVNIASDLSLLEPCLGEVQYVQFMGIASIGKQGQSFDRRVLEKIRAFHTQHSEVPIQVDGGVSVESAEQLLALGVSSLVVGSGILRARDAAAAFAEFEALQSSFGV